LLDETFEKEWTIVMADKVLPLSEKFGGWPGTNGTLKIDWDPTVVEFEEEEPEKGTGVYLPQSIELHRTLEQNSTK